jgi:hypothetical protein
MIVKQTAILTSEEAEKLGLPSIIWDLFEIPWKVNGFQLFSVLKIYRGNDDHYYLDIPPYHYGGTTGSGFLHRLSPRHKVLMDEMFGLIS